MATPPFVLIVAPRPVYTDVVTISPTQFAFNVPVDPPITSIALFLAPGATLPDDTLAGIYVQSPSTSADFKLFGGLSNETPSAIFNLPEQNYEVKADMNGEAAMMDTAASQAAAGSVADTMTIGISIEAAATLLPQLNVLPPQQTNASASLSLVHNRSQPQTKDPLSTKVLAQRIIGNAFNFLASFSGSVGPGGEEVVPLKSFRDWWTKFEKRIQLDPGFLEREVDG